MAIYQNFFALQGRIKKIGYTAAGEMSKGKRAEYSRMWALLEYPPVGFTKPGAAVQTLFGGQSTFLTIRVPQRQGKTDDASARRCVEAVNNGWTFASVMGSFGQRKDGKNELIVPFKALNVSSEPKAQGNMNTAFLVGTARNPTDKGWLMVEESYMIPGRDGEKATWKERTVRVFAPWLAGQATNHLEGRIIIVQGKVVARDLKGGENLFVLAEGVQW